MKNLILSLAFYFSIASSPAQSPDFDWVKQLGDTAGNLFIVSSATDAHGDLYMTGLIAGSVDLDPGPSTALFTDAGFGDLIVFKIDSAGNFAWAKQIGRESYDQGSSLALDANGNVYVTGFFSADSTDFDPGSGTYYLSNSFNSANTFLLKLDPSGNFQWARSLGPESNSPSSITIDDSGKILLTGIFGGSVDFDPGPGTTVLSAINNDSYILKLDSSGNFIWVKQIDAGITNSRTYSIATDGNQNIYLSGLLLGTIDLDPGSGVANFTASSGQQGEFILKLDPSGNYTWAKTIAGNITQTGGDRAIRVDVNGNSYSTGWFGNTVDFDPNAGVFNMSNTVSTGSSTYLLMIDSAGNLDWAKQVGDPADGNPRYMALDNLGNLYLTGTFNTSGDFDPGSGSTILSAIDGDVFIAKYDPSGNLFWALNYSAASSNSGHSTTLTIDNNGNVLSTGSFYGTGDFDPGAGVYPLTSNQFEAVFIHKLVPGSISGINSLSYPTQELIAYPNPCSGTCIIQANKGGIYSLINETGQVVRSCFINSGEKLIISLTGLSNGLYFLANTSLGNSEHTMILIQN